MIRPYPAVASHPIDTVLVQDAPRFHCSVPCRRQPLARRGLDSEPKILYLVGKGDPGAASVTITFRSTKLEKCFNSQKSLVREYGKANAKKIAIRMQVLAAAPNLAAIPTVPPDRCHELTGDRPGQFAVDLLHPFRLLFRPSQSPMPVKEDGGIDLRRVTAIEILVVEDYH